MNSALRCCAFVLFVLLIGAGASAQRTQIDSLTRILNGSAAEGPDRIDLLERTARCSFFTDPLRGASYAKEAIALARSRRDRARLGLALDAWVGCVQSAGDVRDVSKEIDEAIAILRDPPQGSSLAWALLRRALNKSRRFPADTVHQDLLEALRWFRSASDRDGEGAALAQLAFALREVDQERSLRLFGQAEEVLGAGGSTAQLVRALEMHLLTDYMYGRTVEGIQRGEQALELATAIGADRLINETTSLLGNLFQEAGQFDRSIKYFIESMRAAEVAGDSDGVVVACLNLGPLYRETGDTSSALSILRRGTDLAERTHRPDRMTYALNALGSMLMDRGEHARALACFERALSMCPHTLITGSVMEQAQCVATSQWHISAAKRAMGDQDGAFEAILISEQESQKADLSWELAMARCEHARLLANCPASVLRARNIPGQQQYREAAYLAQRALDAARSGAWLEIERDALVLLAEMHERMGDPAAALAFQKQLMTVKDSILDSEKAKAISGLRIRYEVEKKEQQIHLLAKEKELQEQDMKEQKLLRNGIIGGLALVALFIWSRLRSTRRANARILKAQRQLMESERQREAEQVRTRIARDVHDDISSDITKIGMLGADAKYDMASDAEAARVKLDRIKELSRDVGRSLQDIVWAVDPTQDSARELVDRARVYAERMLTDARIQASLRFEHAGPDVALDPATRRDILLLLKEALNNALKYADARQLEVSLITGPPGFELRVRDDGRGFDIGAACDLGNGLGNMETRAKRLGAAWSIDSAPGRGTEVTAKGAWAGRHIGIGV